MMIARQQKFNSTVRNMCDPAIVRAHFNHCTDHDALINSKVMCVLACGFSDRAFLKYLTN